MTPVRWIGLVLAPLLLAGCASNPPTAALRTAEDGVLAARQVKAGQYAAADLARAESALAAARAALTEGDYDEAERQALRAQVEAELAAARSRMSRNREEVESKQQDNAHLRQRLLGEGR